MSLRSVLFPVLLAAALPALSQSISQPAQPDPAAPAAPAVAAPVAGASAAAPSTDQATAPAAPPAALDATGLVKGSLALKGKRFYIAEYRVLFEVSGRVTASTRAAYFGGRDYGATRVTVNYELPQPDVALFQSITDQAYADFLARMKAAGIQPEPTEAFVRDNGAVYEASVEASKPGAPVFEEVDLGYGKRKYLVMAPTGTRMVSRGFIGMGAGNIGKRMDFVKGQMEGVSVGIAVNLAAQESSGGGSSMFKRGSSANASAAMEVTTTRGMGLIQAHAAGGAVMLNAPVPVPGQFANLRETGGYDSQKDPIVAGINMLGRLTMGLAGNNSKKVDMVLEIDPPALARQSLQGIAALNQAALAGIQ
ncbi:MAG TPA: hypothetical protein VLI46_16135 [Ramlibacter sp.]|nr:hypothetical protein [Ramlibacter sp.]